MMNMKFKLLMLVLLSCGIAVSSQAQQALVADGDTVAFWQNDTIVGLEGEVLLTIDSNGTVSDPNGSPIYSISSSNVFSDSNGDQLGSVLNNGEVHDANNDLLGTVSGGEARDINGDLMGVYGGTPPAKAGLYFFFIRSYAGL